MSEISNNLGPRIRRVFLVAVLFRVLFIFWGWTGWHALPQGLESKMYFRQGFAIAAGYGYAAAEDEVGRKIHELYDRIEYQKFAASPATVPSLAPGLARPDTAHPPGLPIIVAVLHRLLGSAPDIPVEILGALFDSAAAALLCWLVAKTLNAAAGYATGLIYALFPPLAYGATFNLMPDGMMAVFVVGGVAGVWQAMQPNCRSWLGWCTLAGVSLGVGSYLRPDYMLLPVALGAGAWAFSHEFWRSFRNLIFVQVVVMIVLLPWAYRNHEACGRWVFTSTGVGGTLVTGLGEFSNPWGIPGTDQDRAREAEAQGLSGPWTSEGDVYFRGVFWKAVRGNPVAFAQTALKRLPLALAPPLSSGFSNPYKEKSLSEFREREGKDRYGMLKDKFAYLLRAYAEMIVVSGISFLALMAWLFTAWRERSRWGVCFFLFSPHLYAIGTHLLTHFEPRFLLPTVGFLLIGLGYVMAGACWWWRSRVVPAGNRVAGLSGSA